MNEIIKQRIEEAAANHKAYAEEFRLKPDTSFICGVDWYRNHQWISVDEELPTERDEEDEQYSTNVFARTKDCIRYAYYDFYNESWCSVEGGYRYRFGGDVTHWMPVPSLEGGEK